MEQPVIPFNLEAALKGKKVQFKDWKGQDVLRVVHMPELPKHKVIVLVRGPDGDVYTTQRSEDGKYGGTLQSFDLVMAPPGDDQARRIYNRANR